MILQMTLEEGRIFIPVSDLKVGMSVWDAEHERFQSVRKIEEKVFDRLVYLDASEYPESYRFGGEIEVKSSTF